MDDGGKHFEKAVKCPDWLKPSQLVSQCDGNETYNGQFDDLSDILGIDPPSTLPPITADIIDGSESSPYTLEQFTTIYMGLVNTEIAYQNPKNCNLYMLIQALNYFRNSEIGEGHVEQALTWLKAYGKMSETATLGTQHQIDSVINQRAKHPGHIFKYIKQDNEEYYNTQVQPIIDAVSKRLQEEQCKEMAAMFLDPEVPECESSVHARVEANNSVLFGAVNTCLKHLNIGEDITLATMFENLNAFESKGISADVIADVCDDIFESGILTPDAKKTFYKEMRKASKSAKDCAELLKTIETVIPEQFDENIRPLLEETKKEAPALTFKNSDYTVEDYKENCAQYQWKAKHIQQLSLCVAINVSGGYILKLRDETTGFHYKHAESTYMKSLFDNSIGFKLTEKDKARLIADKKKMRDYGELNVWSIIKSASAQAKFSKVSSSILDEIIPPKPTSKVLDMDEWWQGMQ
jgi:hypothetical protein